jgi:riboflavin synthase
VEEAVFTGIIEEIGTMRRVAEHGPSLELTIEAAKVLEDIRIGDSIAVNGVCLTVTRYDSRTFTADVMPETYRMTTLSELKPGGKVNLERAMQAGGRYGGHIVQGHIDGVGVIRSRVKEHNAVVFTVEPDDARQLKYIVPRGSIAVDGISLTVVRADNRTFTVSIIPHTLAETVLADKHPGDRVNLETDILGRYIERLLQFGLADADGSGGDGAGPGSGGTGGSGSRASGAAGSARGSSSGRTGTGSGSGLTEAFLRENGFL